MDANIISSTNQHLSTLEAIAQIKAALKARSKTRWSVTNSRGTSYGWIKINARSRRAEMTVAEREELKNLLGLDSVHSMVSIPASSDFYREYVDRAEGRTPSVVGKPYWD